MQGWNGSKILELQSKEVPVVAGKVKGSSPHYPYIETHVKVEISEPKEEEKLVNRIAVLQKCIDEDNKKIAEIDKLYETITDNELKTIFELLGN